MLLAKHAGARCAKQACRASSRIIPCMLLEVPPLWALTATTEASPQPVKGDLPAVCQHQESDPPHLQGMGATAVDPAAAPCNPACLKPCTFAYTRALRPHCLHARPATVALLDDQSSPVISTACRPGCCCSASMQAGVLLLSLQAGWLLPSSAWQIDMLLATSPHACLFCWLPLPVISPKQLMWDVAPASLPAR